MVCASKLMEFRSQNKLGAELEQQFARPSAKLTLYESIEGDRAAWLVRGILLNHMGKTRGKQDHLILSRRHIVDGCIVDIPPVMVWWHVDLMVSDMTRKHHVGRRLRQR